MFPDVTFAPGTTHDDLLNKLQRFFTSARKYWVAITTTNDITITTPAKGLVLTNAAGTVTKRVRLNDLGDGIIIEDV